MQKIFLTFIVMLVLNFQPKTYEPIVVLELFTSQGCSSCPAADDLLNTIKTDYDDNVIPLSYHVDYWNYIGWNDPFSSKVFTQKQRLYNTKFNNRSNYTPQVVVNGQEHFVGSRQSLMTSKINDYSKIRSTNQIDFSTKNSDHNSITCNYNVEGDLNDKKLRIVLVLEERITAVKRGENRNRVLKNANVVVAETHTDLNTASGKEIIKIPEIVEEDDKLRVVAIIENSKFDITGARQLKL